MKQHAFTFTHEIGDPRPTGVGLLSLQEVFRVAREMASTNVTGDSQRTANRKQTFREGVPLAQS